MALSSRSAQVRNLSLAIANGVITLVILLIAPLGLAAVIINTALVAIATYATATIGDRVIRYLQLDTPLRAELMPPPISPSISKSISSPISGEIVSQRSDEIERYKG